MPPNFQASAPNRTIERPAPLSTSPLAKASTFPMASTSSEPISPTSLKRQRSLTEIEGESSSGQQLKRHQFAPSPAGFGSTNTYMTPPTMINSSTNARLNIRAQQPLPARNPVMKAAILNSISRDSPASKELIDRKFNHHRAVSAHAHGALPTSDPSQQRREMEMCIPRAEAETPAAPPLPYTPNYDIFDDEYEDEYETESSIAGESDAYAAFEEDSDRDDHGSLCPFDEVLIEHHYPSAIESKPENNAIAKEIQFELPSERLASEPFF